MIGWLFTNAPRFFGSIEDLAEYAETLTSTDVWYDANWSGSELSGTTWEHLGPEVQVRGLLDANVHPVPPAFGDLSGNSDNTFNMVRPPLNDVLALQRKRKTMLEATMEAMGPQAFGSASAGPTLLTTTLPFCHLLLGHTQGRHRTLQFLPPHAMRTIRELSSFGSGIQRADEKWVAEATEVKRAVSTAEPKFEATALADDPVEDF